MRVAIFTETYFPFISGVVTHIQTLKQGLEAQGHSVLIVTLDPKCYRHYLKNGVLYCPAVSLKRIYGYGLANPINLRRLNILKHFNPDIIHLHTEFSMGIFALFAARRLKKPVVYTLHTMYDDYVFYLFNNEKMGNMAKPAAHAYIRRVAKDATEIIGPSKKVAEYLRRCGVNKFVNIVPNTVDTTAFKAENIDTAQVAQLRQQLGLSEKDIGLCFVGRLGKEKDIDVLINTFAEATQGDNRFKLFIIGTGPEKEALTAQIEANGLQNKVKLLGRIEHDALPPYYHACDLFTTASLSEMNSISLLEATASGLYAVNMLDPANRDQITSGQNGEVFTTVEQYKSILSDYASKTKEQRITLRQNVAEFASRYGRKEFTDSILDVYNDAQKHFPVKL